MTKAIAIKYDIEDVNTGAIASYHVIEYISVDFKYKSITATVNGYVSERSYNNGKNPLVSHTVTISEMPDGGEVTRDWLYRRAIAETEGNMHTFSGGELVEVDDAETVEEPEKVEVM